MNSEHPKRDEFKIAKNYIFISEYARANINDLFWSLNNLVPEKYETIIFLISNGLI